MFLLGVPGPGQNCCLQTTELKLCIWFGFCGGQSDEVSPLSLQKNAGPFEFETDIYCIYLIYFNTNNRSSYTGLIKASVSLRFVFAGSGSNGSAAKQRVHPAPAALALQRVLASAEGMAEPTWPGAQTFPLASE